MINDRLKLLAISLGDNRLKFEVDIKEYFKTNLSGIAEAFYIATTTKELIKVIQLCGELKLDFYIFGSGSKVTQFPSTGVIIKNRSDDLKIFGVKGKISRQGLGVEEAFIEADSGVSLARLSQYAKEQGLGGLEIVETMTGTLGGSLYFLSNLQEYITQIKALEDKNILKTKSFSDLTKGDIILSVVFHLKTKKV